MFVFTVSLIPPVLSIKKPILLKMSWLHLWLVDSCVNLIVTEGSDGTGSMTGTVQSEQSVLIQLEHCNQSE